jgi:hypothetical protein
LKPNDASRAARPRKYGLDACSTIRHYPHGMVEKSEQRIWSWLEFVFVLDG